MAKEDDMGNQMAETTKKWKIKNQSKIRREIE